MAAHASEIEKNPELWSNLREASVNFEAFYLIGKPKKVCNDFTIRLTPLTYLPKIGDSRRDWVASVAVPAFLAHRKSNNVRRFATVGTGSGLDAIAALEIFDLEKLAITDLHPAVVDAAANNIKAAISGSRELEAQLGRGLIARAGDILLPLEEQKGTFELIYENLPNIPLDTSTRALLSGQTSSTYVPDRAEKIHALAQDALLSLHWLALVQARPLLAPGGAVLSSIGGRVPLVTLFEMAQSAGYMTETLIMTWKIQSEPEEVIGGYKRSQENGRRPFYFYPAALLEKTFSKYTPEVAGQNAAQIEQELAPHRLDAIQAYEAHKAGAIIGHTVVVLRSRAFVTI